MTDVSNFNDQSLGEEISNSISHGFGAAIFIVGTVMMILESILTHKSPLTITSVSIFGATLILLYLTSCIYHALKINKGKKVFQILDHCMIFVLITGTYTPVCLSMIGGWIGWTIWGVNVACSIIGIVFNAIDLKKWHKLSLFLYVIMGWSIVFATNTAIKVIPHQAILFVVLGGVFYTLGVIFYRMKGKYMHFIWHLFVLLGSLPHFYAILKYCCMA